MPDLVSTLIERVLAANGRDLECYALAWARVVPTVLIVPVFGLRALAVPVRVALGLVLAIAAAPAVPPLEAAMPFAVAFAREFGRGAPVALGAAALLWTASTAGAIVDDWRGVSPRPTVSVSGGGAGAMSALLGVFASVVFLESGGPARIVGALFLRDVALTAGVVARVTMNLVSAVAVAVSVAAPVVVAASLLELVVAFGARVTHAIVVPAAYAPLRALVLMVLVVWLFRSMLAVLAVPLTAAPW